MRGWPNRKRNGRNHPNSHSDPRETTAEDALRPVVALMSNDPSPENGSICYLGGLAMFASAVQLPDMRCIRSLLPLLLAMAALVAFAAPAADLLAQGGTKLARADTAAGSPLDTVRARNSGLEGTVIDPVGQPLARVELYIAGTDVSTVSDGAGRWRFEDPPAGGRVIHARLLGWIPVTRAVRVTDNVRDTIPLVMRRFPRTLSTVEVRAATNASIRNAAMLAERLMQLRVGTGKLFTREDVLRLQPYSVADLVRTVVGVDVTERDGSVRVTTRRAGTGAMQIKGQGCELQFYLDGHAVDGDLVSTLSPLQFQSVEVHPQNTLLTGLPSYPNRCGAVVINTLAYR